MSNTPINELSQIHAILHKTFKTRVSYPIAWRQHQLLQIARMLQDNQSRFADALFKDLGRPKLEAYLAEINPVIERAILSATKLPEWTKPENKEDEVEMRYKDWKPRVFRTPKGVGLVIAPWNYPLILSLQPLIGAIAAGCCCVVKPSEIAANYASLLAELIPQYLDQSAVRIVLGAVPETTKLLEFKWDHIFYTGNGSVARIIAAAAAKHLTPMTLELGGKSPVIIDPNYDLDIAARRILWGKISNAGQLCVSPDHIYLPTASHPTLLNDFIAALKRAYTAFYPSGPLNSDSFSSIINKAHFSRITDMLSRTQGEVVIGGGKDEARIRIEPTVVKGVPEGDSLLETEIFGPVLPLVEVGTVDEAIERINEKDYALVLYVFSESEDFKEKVRKNTMSGGIVFNDTFMQLDVKELPFGGTGDSGYGRQVLRYSFEAFSYLRSSIDAPISAESGLTLRYPPYTRESFDILCAPAVSVKIPESTSTDGIKV